MRKISAILLVIVFSFVFACATPVYATRHQVNKEARAAQKRNRKRAKAMRKEIRAHQKAARHSAAHH
jgi:hypothetical protein